MNTDRLNEHELVESFDRYWNSVRFSKGWATPSVSRNDVKPLLQNVAQAVNKLCKKCNVQPCSTADLLEGAAEATDAFFSTITYHPMTEPRRFIFELVSSIVKAAPSRFPSIDDAAINSVIDEVLPKQDSSSLSEIAKYKLRINEILSSINAVLPTLKETGALSSWRSLVQSVSLAEQRMKILQSEQEEQQDSTPTLRLPAKTKRQRKKKRVDDSVPSVTLTECDVETKPTPETTTVPVTQPQVKPDADVVQPSVTEQKTEQPAPAADDTQLTTPLGKLTAEEEHAEPSQIVEIKKVDSMVNDMAPKIMSIKERATKLDLDDLSKHPNTAYDYVTRLHRDSIQYSEDLMKSLFQLDGLVCNMNEKPLRKSVVQKIQAMLDSMDEINNDLHDIQEKLNEKRLAEKQAEEQRLAEEKRQTELKRQAEEVEAQRLAREAEEKRIAEEKLRKQQLAEQQRLAREAEQARLAEEKRRLEEQQRRLAEQQRLVEQRRQQLEQSDDESSDDDEEAVARLQQENLSQIWRDTRWEPRTDVQELEDAYVIHVLAPGMSSENFEIGANANRVLNITGTRAPTLQQIMAIREEARRLGVVQVTDQHVVQLANGRFGSFRLQYSIPDDVDDTRISAKYDKGVLTIIMRKKPLLRRPIGVPFYDWM